MGEISKKIEELLKKRKLNKIVPTKELIEKEVKLEYNNIQRPNPYISTPDISEKH